MFLFPTFETCERILFVLRLRDGDERMLLSRRRHTRRLTFLLFVIRRPRSVAVAFLFVLRGELEQFRQRAGGLVHAF